MSLALIFATIQSIATGYALWKGGMPERIVGVVQLSAWFASRNLDVPFVHRYYSVSSAIFLIDTLMLMICLVVALAANRRWTLMLVSLQVVMVLMHITRLVDASAIRLAYQVMINVWSYPQIALLMVGTALHQRRCKRNGSDPDWSNYSHRLMRALRVPGQTG
ncbi:hypothetical protein KY084_15280 [Stakelama sp. CBK3Z-3]|uniref:Uncharacterized protein n=1 Tax=Stakelama flava TaxID=2860338 RepID=A0ABS6XPS2_9SPHN|nr:hypothetical protein [Stakelama flava]MBW4332222.1 hypothetical protein [Stakelama flava]